MQIKQGMFSGAGTGSGSAVPINPPDRLPSLTRIQVTFASTGVVQFEEQIDGTWVPTLAINVATGLAATVATSSGVYLVHSSGADGVRAYPSTNATGCTITGTCVPGGSTAPPFGAGASGDGQTASNVGGVAQLISNGSTLDVRRGNTQEQVIGAAVRTAGATLGATNRNARGVVIIIRISAASGTGGVTFFIEGNDTLNGLSYPILQSALIIAVQTLVLRVYPGLVAAANLTANDVLPRNWQIRTTHGDASNYTYAAVAQYVL